MPFPGSNLANDSNDAWRCRPDGWGLARQILHCVVNDLHLIVWDPEINQRTTGSPRHSNESAYPRRQLPPKQAMLPIIRHDLMSPHQVAFSLEQWPQQQQVMPVCVNDFVRSKSTKKLAITINQGGQPPQLLRGHANAIPAQCR